MRLSTNIFFKITLLAGLYTTSFYNYLLFHSLAEGFAVVIACGVFMVTWNTRRFASRHFLLIIGVAYLFIGILDFLHTLAYSEMNVFPGFGANESSQLWIAARYMQGLTLLVAPFMLHRRIAPLYYMFLYAAVSTVLVLSIFIWPRFPDCYLPGMGLTPFKVFSEYLICLILVAAGLLLLQRRQHFDRAFLAWTLASIAVTILSELAFTSYASVFGVTNLLGHLLKIVAFYLIYKAVIEIGLTKPYNLLFRDLQHQREHFRVTLTSLAEAVIATDTEGRITFSNPMAEVLTGQTAVETRGRPISSVLRMVDGQSGQPIEDPLAPGLRDGDRRAASGHPVVITRDGRRVPIESSVAPIRDTHGQAGGAVLVFRDISERRQAEEKNRAALAEKEVLLKEIHHRVKNNMQVISSLVALQAEEVRDPAMRGIFQDVVYRVHAMAMVHEKLYQSTDLARVEFGDYAESLLGYLQRAQGAAAAGIRLELDMQPVYLPVNAAVPCGLILSELFTNALKHAFRGRSGGRVNVSLGSNGNDHVRLTLSDDGVGLPAGLDVGSACSLGLRLVQMLAGQLRADVEVRRDNGTTFSIVFQVPPA